VTLCAFAIASCGSDASTKPPSNGDPELRVPCKRSGEAYADQQGPKPGHEARPEDPIINSSPIGFLSSSFEPRPPLASRFVLLAIDLLSSSTAPLGAAVLNCLLRPAQSAQRGYRFFSDDGVA
jgi:hypothetical protein